MAYNIVRLTLYALIVAIESDLRAVIGSDVLSHRTPEELLPPLVYERAHDRMRRDVGFDQEFDATLVEYLDFAECIEVLSSSKAAFTGPVVQAIKRIAKHASKLTQIRNRVMHARPLEYDDFAYITNFASELLSLPEPLFPALRQTKASIAKDPASVLSLSLEEQRPETAKASHNLPIPDFDETGFLGRSSEEAALVRLCKSSPWPVITIVGQGGMGKTALALKVAYNLIDDTDAKYDAVIWSTSKTTTLTVSDIKEIDGAIRSSIGLFEDIARTLVNPAATVSEIVEFLNSFKNLLILDNLETVLDQRIRDFLCQIESSSKVLITSRVGLGELEYRFPLDGMKVDDAVALLRATAQVRRADQLIRTSNSTLRAYCSKMESNPLFIKWFVSCVQSGKRAEEVLQNSQVFLDYCLRNVIEFLSEDARLVAKAMIAVAGPHTQAVLSYLTRLEGERLQIALQQLMVANVVTLVGQPGGSGIASAYDLAELPRRYLLKTYAPTPDEIISFSTQRNKLARTLEFVNAQSTASPYSPNTVVIRSRDDVVVAKYLLDALSAVRQKKGPEAIAFLTSAKTLAPTYAEVYRVEGWAHFFSGNYAAAKQAYETALELEPKSAALRYWYAGFLMRGYNDAESAASELKIAQELDPTSPDVRVEYSRALSYQFKFAEADEQLTPVIETDAGSTKLMRIAYDAWIQIAIRRAKFISTNFNYLAALEALEEVIRRFDSVPKSYLDRKILASVAQCTRLAQAIAFQLDQSNESNRAASLADKFGDVSKSITQYAARFGSQESVPKHIPVGGEAVGTIEDINPLGTFGFINVAGGGRLYFKGKEVDRTTVSRPLRVGDQLKFIVGMGDRGRIAERIEVVRQPSDDLCDDVGEIVSIASDFSSGVIRARDGEEYFFPRTELRSPKHMSYLEPGCPVRFVRGAGAAHSEGKERRPTAFSIEQQCSSLLNDALSDGRRLSAPIRWLRKRDAIARTPGGEVLVHPEQFCDRADWYDLKEGDIITFGVGLSEGQKFFGREIRLEKTR